MNCNEQNRVYPHKGMTPVEISNPVDRKWRQIRDIANKDIATRKAITEFDEDIQDRAIKIQEEMSATITLGGLHPNTHTCMGE